MEKKEPKLCKIPRYKAIIEEDGYYYIHEYVVATNSTKGEYVKIPKPRYLTIEDADKIANELNCDQESLIQFLNID